MTLQIKEQIKKRNLTIQEVADVMKISRVGLSQHINGNPSVEVLERIADAIGCDVGDFFTRKDDNVATCPNCGVAIKLNVEKE